MSDALAELSRFAAALEPGGLPREVVQQAEACLLYGLSVGIATVGSPHPARALAAFPASAGPIAGRTATTLLDGRPREADASAFCNAVLMHARIQEDAHPAGHIGVVVIPAALAACEATGADGARLLAAVIAGYEVALRLGSAHSADLSRRGFRTTPTYGAIGAAAAVARVHGLDASMTAHAMALAANFCGGLREFVAAGSDEWSFQAGHAAHSGLLAVVLARAGVRAAATTLNGAAGFFKAYGREDVDYERGVVAGLSHRWSLLEVTYKPYPVCQFHRGVVRGALEIRRQAAGRRIAAFDIRMNPFEADFIGVRHAGPFTSFPQTFMSAPFCAALALARGAVSLSALHDFDAGDVLEIIARTAVTADTDRPRYHPHLSARLDDGRLIDWEETRGDEAYRLDWSKAVAMGQALTDEVKVPRPIADHLAGHASRLLGSARIDGLIFAAANACAVARDRCSETPST